MPAPVPLHRRLATAATWPAGVLLTSWFYVWRTTPIHRREFDGTPERDLPPPLPPGVPAEEIQLPRDGSGPVFHRVYTGRVLDSSHGPEALIAEIARNPNRVAPITLARFHRTAGDPGRIVVGDEFRVRMPGPWDGPIRAIKATPASFRFATLDGHLEAGQIEWRAHEDDGVVVFQIESWARAGDRLSAIMHDRLRMAKEVQLHMWTSVVEQVTRLAGGRLECGVDIETHRIDPSLLSALE
jgi:Domain of unknown function (DUF1990)